MRHTGGGVLWHESVWGIAALRSGGEHGIRAVHEVGATPTAIMGALEPLTAVAIGVMVFGESLTFKLMVGIVLILSAVLLIVLGKNFHLRTITHTISTIVRKTWRWKS